MNCKKCGYDVKRADKITANFISKLTILTIFVYFIGIYTGWLLKLVIGK